MATQDGYAELVSVLLDNAVKYCDEGGAVCALLSPQGRQRAVFSVSNGYAAGAGLDCSRFFERFYRQDESHSSRKSGFGIGLSIAQQITEKLGGAIQVRWVAGTITFQVSFPVLRQEARAAGPATNETEAAE